MARAPRRPVRTCVGCRQEAGKGELLRVVRLPEGGAVVDRTGGAPGRGAYIHRDPGCIQTAQKRGALERALKTAIGSDVWTELSSGKTIK